MVNYKTLYYTQDVFYVYIDIQLHVNFKLNFNLNLLEFLLHANRICSHYLLSLNNFKMTLWLDFVSSIDIYVTKYAMAKPTLYTQF